MSRSQVHLSRDAILFTAGLLGVVHVIVLQEETRAEILLLLGAMMGLPAFLNRDEQRAKSEGQSEPPTEKPEG